MGQPHPRLRPPVSGRRAAIVIVALAAAACGPGQPPPSPPPTPTPRPTPPPFRSAHPTEQEWLAATIVRDVAEMAFAAEARRLPGGEQLRLAVRHPDAGGLDRRPVAVEVSLALRAGEPPRTASATVARTGHLWDPQEYRGIATALLAVAPGTTARPAPGAGAADRSLLTALLDLRAKTLLAEDDRLSRQIEAAPRSPDVHERAALLVGALALREAAGSFTDTRLLLGRMTAHLALAAALRGEREPGLSGAVAAVVLSTLVGREREALDGLDRLAPGRTPPALAAWARALRLRNTGDWRVVEGQRRPSLLEKLEEFRARSIAVSLGDALETLDRRGAEDVPDWGAIAASGRRLTVEGGNRLLGPSLALQMMEADGVSRALGGEGLDPETWQEALNRPAGRGVEARPEGGAAFRVLGWAAWAPFLQRHVIHLVERNGSFTEGSLSLPGQAEAYAEGARTRFGRLTLFPVVQRRWASDARGYRAAMAGVQGLAERTPELLPAATWGLLVKKPHFAEGDRSAAAAPLLPDHASWFAPPLPSGTVYDVGNRLGALPALGKAPAEALTALHELAPHQYDLAWAEIRGRRGRSPKADDVAGDFGALAEYDVRALGDVADRAWYEPEAYRRFAGKQCELDSGQCFVLGHRLAELGFPHEAAAAYQRGFDRAQDRVKASNRCSWLVEYYLARGEEQKALAVSREAAEVYSAAGLSVHAGVLERLGRLREAEDTFLSLHERYPDAQDHAGFYYRRVHVAGDRAFAPKLEDALRAFFPSGLEKLDRAALTAPPTDGAVFRSVNDNTKKHGLRFGDVVVGAYGWRVRNMEQYGVVRDFDLSTRLELTVWQGQAYQDVTADLPDRRFRVDMATFTPARK